MTRTNAYRFTVQLENGKPVAEQAHLVDALKAAIAAENTWKGIRQYVKLQGRGHRHGVRHFNDSLPLPYATSADVYVYTRFR
jgi:hypothetical protein